MYKLAIGIQKGGTGKTTTTVCLGGALALRGRKVLILDLDPQANATKSLVPDRTQLTTPTIHELLLEPQVSLADVVVRTGYGLDLVPANIGLALAEKQLMAATSGKKLYRKLREAEELNKKHPELELGYDYVLMDCPPSLGVLTLNALAAADGALTPLDCEYFAEEGLNDFLNTMNEVKLELNEGLQMVGVLLTKYSATKTHKDVANNLRHILGDKVLTTMITRRAILTELPLRGPIQAYAPSSEAAEEYNALAVEVENHVG